MAELLTAQALFTLLMLILLQAVLGFDNLLYIAIESNKVGDEKDAKKVRKWGIGIAVALRIVLLFLIVKLFALLAEPLFSTANSHQWLLGGRVYGASPDYARGRRLHYLYRHQRDSPSPAGRPY